MSKKLRSFFNKISKHLGVFVVIALIIGSFAVITKVSAVTVHGSGSQCFNFDIDENGFPVSSITINGEVWDRSDAHEYRSNDNVYTIVIKAGKKGEDDPWISTAGGMDDYKRYYAVLNPVENPDVEGDEYLLTLILHDLQPQGNATCSSTGVSLQPGPFPVYDRINASANITITVIGDELEYHYVAEKPDEPDVTRFKFGINSMISEDLVPFTFGNANYTHNDKEPPNNVTSVTTINPIPYDYVYIDDGSGTVEFCVNGGAEDEYTRIEINGVDYSDQAPHTQSEVFEHIQGRASFFCIKGVPYNAESYDVIVEGSHVPDENTVAGFGWSYLNRERSNLAEDEPEGNFAHGRLEFVSAKYTDIDNVDHVFNSVQDYNNAKFHDTGEIYEWVDGRKDYPEEDRRIAWGEALVPYGTELTVRVVPDEGYQLISFSTSPNGFQATDEVGVYKIVLTKENFFFGEDGFELEPVFAEVGHEVVTDSETVNSGFIATEQQLENGTLKLEVTDANVSEESRASFEETAEDNDFEILSYVDLSLYNSIYKGGKKDANDQYLSWDTAMNNLDQAATITLELSEDMGGKELAIIHEEHENEVVTGYDVIDAVYNSENNTITFETDGFSNYAIVYKTVENPQYVTVYFDTRCDYEIEPKEVMIGNSVSQPEDPENGDMIFDGWFEDDTCNARFDFNSPIMETMTLFANWLDPEGPPEDEEPEIPRDKEFSPEDANGNEITFMGDSNRTYQLIMENYLNLTDDELDEKNINKDDYETAIDVISNATKSHGVLLAAVDIIVRDNTNFDLHEGPFEIRIKMTDEMKQYNTFKIIYVKDDFSTEEPITLTVDGDYLVGTLPHLSFYVITGSNTSGNPDTHDGIYLWVITLLVSITGMVSLVRFFLKKQII